MNYRPFRRYFDKFAQAFARWPHDTGANIAIMFGLLAPVMVAGIGLGTETMNWYRVQRDLQNAADEAAIAAATNGTSSYNAEALATTANYGYANGSSNVTVTASNAAVCPASGHTCYSVTVTKKVPLYFPQVIGYTGNATIGSAPALSLSATAIAMQGTTPRNYCLLSLSTTGTGILANGVPDADLSGCNIMSDSNATCHGHNTQADIGDAVGTNDGCGVIENSNMPAVSDPYSHLASNIPANTCTSYPQEGKHGGGLPASNQLYGTYSWSGNNEFCGDIQLTANVTINAPSGAVMIIENGQLDTNGYTFQTSSGSYLTVIFSGTTSGSYTHAPTGGGTLSFQGPTSGTWSGVAIYDDPSIKTGTDVTAAGNSPSWSITGLVYEPNANDTFSGAVNKFATGASCFVLVVNTVTINGTGSILEHDGCPAAGLAMPTSQLPGRGQLVI